MKKMLYLGKNYQIVEVAALDVTRQLIKNRIFVKMSRKYYTWRKIIKKIDELLHCT